MSSLKGKRVRRPENGSSCEDLTVTLGHVHTDVKYPSVGFNVMRFSYWVTRGRFFDVNVKI